MSNNILKMDDITKEFPGVLALDKVNFKLEKGEVHALVGENGAGKSTLIKILSGAYKMDEGNLYLNNEQVEIQSPGHAQNLGVSVIYQEFNLVPYLTVAENVFLGREPMINNNLIDTKEMQKKARKILQELHIELDPAKEVSKLGVAMQQMVEVVKALSMDADIIVMDEPTAALGDHEIEELFSTIYRLKNKGISIIYISHRLQELWEIADRVTVLRDGKYISTSDVEDTDKNSLIRDMVGRDLTEQFPGRDNNPGKELFKVENLSAGDKLKDITFSLSEGEVLGFAGLVGSGRTELMRCLFGVDDYEKGSLYINQEPVNIKFPWQAIENGIGFITEDRKKQGLILTRSVEENITITDIEQVMDGVFINNDKEENLVKRYIEKLNIKTPGIEQEVRFLSGGNQQKVVLAKWLLQRAKILIFDEPTRGIDVGAKKEVYNLINKLTKNGVGVIMVSSELPEILGMSDRILVMNHGQLTANLDVKEANQQKILKYATEEWKNE